MTRRLAPPAAIVALALIAGACNSGGTATSAPATSEPAESAAATAEATASAPTAVTLEVWYNGADPQAFADIYQAYAEASGNVLNTIPTPSDAFETTITTKWAAGDRPDILEYHATSLFWALNPTQNLRDLTAEAFVTTSGDLYKQGAASLNGVTYGAVTGFPELYAFFYNKNVLADAGLDVPESFADLQAGCETLKASSPDIPYIFESGGSAWPTQILPMMLVGEANADNAYADSVLAKTTTLAAPDGPLVQALTMYKELQTSGCFNEDITTAQFEDSVRAVYEGRAAMVALPASLLSFFNDAAEGDTAAVDETIGFAAPSATKMYGIWAPGVPGTWYLPKTGDPSREAAALDFLHWVTGPGYQQLLESTKSFPVIDGYEAPDGIQAVKYEVKDIYDTAASLAFNTNLPGFNSQFATTVSQVISDQLTPEAAGELSQQQLEQGAQAAGLPGW